MHTEQELFLSQSRQLGKALGNYHAIILRSYRWISSRNRFDGHQVLLQAFPYNLVGVQTDQHEMVYCHTYVPHYKDEYTVIMYFPITYAKGIHYALLEIIDGVFGIKCVMANNRMAIAHSWINIIRIWLPWDVYLFVIAIAFRIAQSDNNDEWAVTSVCQILLHSLQLLWHI